MLLLLFISSFLAATILPLYSEAVLLGLMNQGTYSLWMLWGVATLGNTLGAVFNWMLGRYLLHFQHKKWFPFSPKKLVTSQSWFQRYGVWSLLFSWLPVVGDAFTFIAGTMRVKLMVLILLCGIGKGLRYAIVLVFAEYFLATYLVQ